MSGPSLWWPSHWQSPQTLQVWLGERSCCLMQAGQVLLWHRQAAPLTPQEVLDLLQPHPHRKGRLLLEFPWVWLEATETLPVDQNEWPFYLQHRLQLPEPPGSQQTVGWQHLSDSPSRTLLALLSPPAHQLRQALLLQSARWQVLPALLPWWHSLPEEGNWVLKGLEQTAVLAQKAGQLQDLWFLPQSPEIQSTLLEDLLAGNVWQEQGLVSAEGALQTTRLHQILQVPHPEQGFEWYRRRAAWKDPQRWLFGTLLLSVLTGSVGGMIYWEERREVLRRELQQLEVQLQQVQRARPPVDLAAQQAWENWTRAVAERPRLNSSYLQELPTALGEAWLENLHLTPTGAELVLLLLQGAQIPTILQQLEALPFVGQVQLSLQRQVELEGQDVQQLRIRLQWQPLPTP